MSGTGNGPSIADFGMQINAMGGGGDVGQSFPASDAKDFADGARFVPGEVTLARRRGEKVAFHQDCLGQCCWYWEMPDGDRIYHWEPGEYASIATTNGKVKNAEGNYGDAGPCPRCGNIYTNGGIIKASQLPKASAKGKKATKKTVRKESVKGTLAGALAVGSSGEAIRNQEAAGQQSFVNSDTLPTKMSREDRQSLEKAGVIFGEVVEEDPLFQYVQLPAGWKKTDTGHSMHNDLLDDKGRKRAGIFYKAAFYDRRADLHCVRRFGVHIDYDKLEKEKVAVAEVTDGGKVIHTTEPLKFKGDNEDAATENASTLAEGWLNAKYPDWENAAAYWD